jgi:N-acetylglutamate synthase-like GNAT family acetyltransferase
MWVEIGSDRYAEARALRYRVLRAPLGMPPGSEENRAEGRCAHCVAVWEGQVVGCVLWLPDELGGAGKLLQMAVAPEAQGRGTGARLVAEVERRASVEGVEEIYLHARQTAVGFYEKLGYRCSLAPFDEVGLPHRYMSRCLSS